MKYFSICRRKLPPDAVRQNGGIKTADFHGIRMLMKQFFPEDLFFWKNDTCFVRGVDLFIFDDTSISPDLKTGREEVER